MDSQRTTYDEQTHVGAEPATDRVSVSSSELPDTSNLEEFVGKDIGQYKNDPDEIKSRRGVKERIPETAIKYCWWNNHRLNELKMPMLSQGVEKYNTIYQLRIQIHELRVQIHALQIQIHELRVQIYESWVQIHELED